MTDPVDLRIQIMRGLLKVDPENPEASKGLRQACEDFLGERPGMTIPQFMAYIKSRVDRTFEEKKASLDRLIAMGDGLHEKTPDPLDKGDKGEEI